MPFAKDDQISKTRIEGGVEISSDEYKAALDAKLAGRESIVIGGSLVVRDKQPSDEHVWQGSGWVVPEPEPPTFDELKAQKVADLKTKRQRVENGGFVFNSIPLPSDPAMREKITGANNMFTLDPNKAPIDWEVSEGVFMAFDKATIQAIGLALGEHVQGTYDRKKELYAELQKATTEAELDAIDIDAGW